MSKSYTEQIIETRINDAFTKQQTELDLSFMQLSVEYIEIIANNLRDNASLRILNLKNTYLGDKGLEKLVEALKQNNTLETLILTGNNFSNKNLVDELKSNPNIKDLKIDSDSLPEQFTLEKLPGTYDIPTMYKFLKASNPDAESLVITKFTIPLTGNIGDNANYNPDNNDSE